jgi:hypothetical protein
MILYHGSNTKIHEIDLSLCKPYKDFGAGFYTTTLKGQAENMAERVVRLYGGNPCVTAFSLDEALFEDGQIRLMRFEKPCRDWALFVMNNRDRRYTDFSNPLCNQDNKYDVVFGAVANDDMAVLFETFKRELIDLDAVQKKLEYKQLTDQYSFHTAQAIRYLSAVEDV